MITKTRTVPKLIADSRQKGTKIGSWSSPPTFSNYDNLVPGFTMNELEETITYSIGAPDNYCEHSKIVRFLPQYQCLGQGWNASQPTKKILFELTDLTCAELRLYGMAGHASWWPVVPTFTVPGWSHLSGRALQVMWPDIDSNLSSLNFLLELREAKRLPKQILSAVAKLVGVSSRGNLSSLLRKRLRGAGEAILTSQFGLLPLVSDVQALARTLETSRKNAQRILSGTGRQLKSHAKFWVEVPSTTTHTYNAVSDTLHTIDVRKRVVEWTESWYHATMYYSYALDESTKRNLNTLALLDTLGLNLNPGVIWEAIPWSFAVDWLLGVQDALDQFTLKAVRPSVRIERFCHSYKGVRRISRSYSACSTRLCYSPDMLAGYEEQTYYIRKPDIPNFYSSLQTSGLSTREIILTGALAATR